MSEQPSISIIIPALDAAEFIQEQLDALLEQDAPDATEIVIADNGSVDGTQAIVQRVAQRDGRIRLVDASVRPGAANARQYGTAAARGELLLYCDADDIVGPNWIAAFAAALDEGDAAGGRVDHTRLNPPEIRRWRGGSDMTSLPTSLGFLPYALSGNFAVRRAALDAVGGWDLSMENAEDVDLSWRLQINGFRLVYAPEALLHYRHRRTAEALWRQLIAYGRGEALLLRRFRTHGAKPYRSGTVLRRYFYIVTRLPYLALGRSSRGSWVTVAAPAWGRLRGSLRHRVLCL